MTRKTPFIVVGVTALVLAAPAWGKGQQAAPDFWNYDSQTGAKVADTSPGLSAQDLGSLYGRASSLRVAPVGSPDLVDRAIAARQREQAAMLDARERALTQRDVTGEVVSSLDAREQAFGAKRDAQLGSMRSPDVVQRAIDTHTRSIREPVVDDRFRIDPTNGPVPLSVTTSGREVEWPQIGIGFGIGLLLAAGLYFALRLTRTRQLAH